jgi:hypothetical protein
MVPRLDRLGRRCTTGCIAAGVLGRGTCCRPGLTRGGPCEGVVLPGLCHNRFC